ncbi:[Fe-Fe] hydrogenase large subunit C-terminal domain-containing protein [Clostridium grantii]|uniref:Iron only hydrogenase large subunit, C-terminal domain n=1 Tax=Clostridium grantii DSM 8605 TaxID=1121316 RepID=A0A1M5XST2_9CLOT|nr:[Fe-Fe] hydrogenase large subunit C-terminal domain-containing protein [Clostridium grantii]SHI02871.1 Iron only hydrogenase large subunit, C-terminal domain [Clostridium grantii DSM 8605]
MNLINFHSNDCKNCYKCLRHCNVKAIKILDDKAEIIEDKCIACGHCLVVCPQEARYIKSDMDIVKNLLNSKDKVVATIAPSFAGSFKMDNPYKFVTALKKLGFDAVEETAIGANLITKEYNKFIDENNLENIITTCCPSTNYLIEKYYPSLIKYMMPIVSPMVAHGKMIKKKYGEDVKVVFIGPCISKKYEAIDNSEAIDAVLTFEEVNQWFEHSEISIEDLEASNFDEQSDGEGRSYPIVGSIISQLNINEENSNYNFIKVDGLDKCRELLKELDSGNLNNVCVEINACVGGCIGGPGNPKNQEGLFVRKNKVKKYSSKDVKNIKTQTYEIEGFDLRKKFSSNEVAKPDFSYEQIRNVMSQMGKVEKTDELNCGACGYDTCKEKATAVLAGMSEMTMCVPYMRSKAESMTNIIFEYTPNGIFLIDENLIIKEYNPTAARMFMLKNNAFKEKNVLTLLNDDYIMEAHDKKETIFGKVVKYPQYGLTIRENIIYLEEEKLFMIIMNDISIEEKRKIQFGNMKEETMEAAQKVIEKQMRVAQEIASLLGETTAETKVTLTKLKKLISEEDGDIK